MGWSDVDRKGSIMTEQETLINVPVVANDGPAADAVAAAVLDAQMRIIDAAVRQARDNGWCREFEAIMGRLFPDGPPDGSKVFVDSDGLSCRGLDRDGYNQRGLDEEGYDREGRDRNGYDRDGYDRRGWNREGRNRDGQDRNDPALYGFDYFGYDRDGYNAEGRDPWGHTREDNLRDSLTPYRFDREGRDANGRTNRAGY